jgi:hypothetical protein
VAVGRAVPSFAVAAATTAFSATTLLAADFGRSTRPNFQARGKPCTDLWLAGNTRHRQWNHFRVEAPDMKPILLAIGLASLMTLPIVVMRIYNLMQSRVNHEQAIANYEECMNKWYFNPHGMSLRQWCGEEP